MLGAIRVLRRVFRHEPEVEVLRAEREVASKIEVVFLERRPDELVGGEEGLIPGGDLLDQRMLDRVTGSGAQRVECRLETAERTIEVWAVGAPAEHVRLLRSAHVGRRETELVGGLRTRIGDTDDLVRRTEPIDREHQAADDKREQQGQCTEADQQLAADRQVDDPAASLAGLNRGAHQRSPPRIQQ
jgi:hypothetical protein